MKHKRLLNVFGLAVFGLMLLAYKPAAAIGSPVQKPLGITISPAFQQITIKQSDDSQAMTFTITNNKASVLVLKLSTSDFNTLDETGGLFFIGSNPTAIQKKYGLAKWVELPYKTLDVDPGQTVTVNAKVLNLSSLNPGGHYGAINISESTTDLKAANKISVHPVASCLFFVTKLGGDIHRLKLANVYIDKKIYRLPSSIKLRFKNDGNTHLIPRGVVTIVDSKNKIVGSGIINQNSNIILPETYRQYQVLINNISSTSKPGTYYLKVIYRFDGYDKYGTYQSKLVYIPLLYGLLFLGILVGLVIYVIRKSTIKFRVKKLEQLKNN